MIDVITTRTSIQEWKNELNRAMKAAGIRRKDEIYEQLEEGMRSLANLINDFRGVTATLIQPGYRDEFNVGLRVQCDGMDDAFFAYVAYSNGEYERPSVEINFTERPSTTEFPLENGTRWKIVNLKEKEVKNALYVVAHVKNYFIQFESFRRIGNRIIYSILEE